MLGCVIEIKGLYRGYVACAEILDLLQVSSQSRSQSFCVCAAKWTQSNEHEGRGGEKKPEGRSGACPGSVCHSGL